MSYNPEIPHVDLEAELDGSESGLFVRGRQSDDELKLSLIRKVSPTGFFLANRGWIPTTPNSFGLPPGETCPGKTDFCKSCYAFGSIRSKGVKEMLDHNLAILKALETVEDMETFISKMVKRYDDHASATGVADKDKVFRIHWSGDFFSLEYAKAWARTMSSFPRISFWAFTRSFRQPVDVIPLLDGIDNLTLYLSTDIYNVSEIPEQYSHLPRANSALDVVNAQKFSRIDHRTITCPENLDRLKLMQDGEGACIKCRACLGGNVDVNFVTSGKHDAGPRSKFADEVEERAVDIAQVVLRPVNPDLYVRRSSIDQAG